MPPEAPYRHPVGKTLIFLEKSDPRYLHSHDLGEYFVPEGLLAGSNKWNCCRLSGFLRIFTGRYTGRFFPKEMGSFSKIFNLMDIFLWCWHRFHCRIFRPGPARDLSVGESIPGEIRSVWRAGSIGYRECLHSGWERLLRDNFSLPGAAATTRTEAGIHLARMMAMAPESPPSQRAMRAARSRSGPRLAPG